MVQFSFFLSILLSRQAPSSRSRRGTSNVPSIGTFVRATLVAPVVFGSIVMQPVMGVVLTGNANCDASGAIANGALNDCTTALAHGSECTPTCDTGYVISGIRSCSGGTLIDTAVCISSPYEHGRRLLLASSWTQVGGDIDGEAADDKSGSRYRCPRTARAWRSAPRERRQRHMTPATCACTLRAAGRGPRWGRHRRRGCGGPFRVLGIDVLGRHARGDRRVGERRQLAHQTPATCAVYAGERRDVDPGWRRHRRRGCGRPVREVGIDVLGRHARGDRRYEERRRWQSTAATCACTLRAAGRGPRWASDIDGEAAGDESGIVGIDVLGRHARGDRRFRNDG